jgi:alpha-1,3-mannosyltransferase
MKIAHLVRQYAPSVGGLEDYVENLARAQIASGHNVRVVTLNTRFQTGQQLPASEIFEGIEVRRVGWFGSQRYPLAPAVLKHLRDVDIVHVHALDFFVDYLSILKVLGLFKKRLIFSTHGGIFHTPHQAALKRLWFNVITRINLRAFDEVICCSDNDLQLFAPIRDSLRLIENGVLLRKFGEVPRAADGDNFIYLGRFSENKNLFELIEWFAQFTNSCPTARLHIVGRSETGDVAQLQRAVVARDAGAAIRIMPDLNEDQLRAVLAECRYVVSASRYEGFGLSVIELMSYGLAPLLSDIPSFRAFVERGGYGELFELNAAAFCAAARKLVASDTDAEALRAYADGFSWPRVWAQISEVYRAVPG